MPGMPLQSPRMERDAEGFLIMDEPPAVSTKYDGREWALEVPQQPIRARMCGFGDKDRRPITPPPCVRLIVRDPMTGREIDAQDIDISFFVITVDLWDEEAQKEVNLVKHAANSPSISTASAVAYPQTPTANSATQAFYQYPQSNFASPNNAPQQNPTSPYYSTHGQQGYAGVASNYSQYGHTQYGFNHTGFGPNNPQSNGQFMHASPSHPSYMLTHQQQALATPHQPTGMFTRNLIGALSASAFRLHDQNKKFGIWFILQDLSIRTDGIFRYEKEHPFQEPTNLSSPLRSLKFNFVNVGLQNANPTPLNTNTNTTTTSPSNPTSPLTPASAHSSGITPSSGSGASLNTSAAPVLASVFTRPFQVFSAKKFPGVIESTELSRTFAQQGIKIPIRKDGDGSGGSGGGGAGAGAAGKRRRNLEEDDDEGPGDEE
ncbi:hypothetical protein EPUS_03483 [Endocarpon pusillum Z07020]|uniref:Velvet domain-containing protein n=1 Tax=Endocarpon pusillum (strain Z07020 / HMAS-L-300199) TaxID=1263415 RepID=U1HQG1_ENDPU|nr:uncharacterized protein EPUS_03483 [Endocarpon pusillum Z07020]ERF71329.1 hypothetical protein EPUS_03483 [Endocarpon pusillum Z07020]